MYAKRTNDYSSLPLQQRKLVQIARQAVADTVHGGCAALVRANRSKRTEYADIVSAVYSASSGRVPDDYDAFECGECGCIHYGLEAAQICCNEEEE